MKNTDAWPILSFLFLFFGNICKDFLECQIISVMNPGRDCENDAFYATAVKLQFPDKTPCNHFRVLPEHTASISPQYQRINLLDICQLQDEAAAGI